MKFEKYNNVVMYSRIVTTNVLILLLVDIVYMGLAHPYVMLCMTCIYVPLHTILSQDKYIPFLSTWYLEPNLNPSHPSGLTVQWCQFFSGYHVHSDFLLPLSL